MEKRPEQVSQPLGMRGGDRPHARPSRPGGWSLLVRAAQGESRETALGRESSFAPVKSQAGRLGLGSLDARPTLARSRSSQHTLQHPPTLTA